MGYNKVTLEYAEDIIKKSGFDFDGLRICELGNQRMVHFPESEKVAKFYFESLGMIYTSIDWNGRDDALKLDLSEPINIGQFDVVTNYGTSEHIRDNDQCFKNIHNLCRKGGIMIHNLPKEGHWLKHRAVYTRYTIEFFEELIKKYDYEKIDLRYWSYKVKEDMESVFAALRKNNE
jgi:SAM-dependent methyltransferase